MFCEAPFCDSPMSSFYYEVSNGEIFYFDADIQSLEEFLADIAASKSFTADIFMDVEDTLVR